MRKTLLAVVFLSASFFFPHFISSSFAESESLKARVREEMRRLLDEGKMSNKDACGGFAHAETQRTTDTPKGTQVQKLPKEWAFPWGCNPSEDWSAQPTTSATIAEVEKDGDTEIETRATIMLVWNYDKDKESVTLHGRVIGPDGKPKKDVSVDAKNRYNYLGGNKSTKTDANGEYELKLTSGDYSITAKGDGCEKTEQRRLCGFGEATAPPPGAPHKHAPYTQDFKLECGQWVIKVKGHQEAQIDVHDGEASGHGSGLTNVQGCIPVHIDSKTGAISSQGIVTNTVTPVQMDMVGYNMHGFGSGEGTPSPMTYSLTGQASNGQASFTAECQMSSAMSVDATATVCDEGGCTSGSGSSSVGPESCSGEPIHFKLPLEEGATYPYHKVWNYSEQGAHITVTADIDFTLEEKDSCPDTAPTPPPAPGGNGGGPNQPYADGSGGGGGGSSNSSNGGYQGPPGFTGGGRRFIMPTNPEEAQALANQMEQEDDEQNVEEVQGPDESSNDDTTQEVSDLIQQAIGGF